MESVLGLFDFSQADHIQSHAAQVCNHGAESAIEKIENAAAVGNLPSLVEALTDLRAHSQFTLYLERLGNTLSSAVRHEHQDVAEYLIEEKIPILPDAVIEATMLKNMALLELLLKNGWDIDRSLGLTTPSVLALAVEDAALTIWLLERGASPNAQCSLDITALSIAVQHASMNVIQSLFECGGSTSYGQLLHYAVRRSLPDQLEVLDFVLSKQPPINHVMYQDHPQSYYRQRMFCLGTPLHEAAALGKLDMVKRLLRSGSHPLVKDSCGKTSFQRAQKAQQHYIVTYLSPITADAEPLPFQFTEGKETTGWN